MSDWSADQYLKFEQERSQPAYDLMDMIGPRNSMRIMDLGCGTGEHTKTLHERFRAVQTIGIDTSAAMLAKAPRAVGLQFFQADITEFTGDSEYDLIFSNAALHWIPDHESLFATIHKAVRPGGQIAIQMPRNRDHLTQRTAYELEREPPYNQYPGCPNDKNTLAPAQYAELLHRLGFRAIKVRLFVYLHQLDSGADAVEWLRGSLLNHYKSVQPEEVFSLFEKEYRNRIERAIGDEKPYLLTYNRILMHAVR